MKFEEMYNIVKEMHIDKSFRVYYHVTPTENLNSILYKGLISRLGERSSKIEDESDGVFLFGSKEEATDAVMNWLGDEFEENEPLSLLKISIPLNRLSTMKIYHDKFSYISFDNIPAEFIVLDDEEL
jgi:hypothetical protein